MIPRILHTVWLGPKPLPEQAPVNSPLFSGWGKRVWTEDNASELGIEPWQWEHTTRAGQSNVIRLHALLQFGGVYLDTDFDVLRPFDPLLQHSAFVARQPDGIFCNAAMGSEPHHPWIRRMVDSYGDPRIQSPAYACYLIEPNLTPDVVVLPDDTFYPYNWNEKPKPPTPNTFAVHRWAGSWLPKPCLS